MVRKVLFSPVLDSTTDMVPSYAIQNAARTPYCIYNQEFQNSPRQRSIWEALKTKAIPVLYTVSIESVGVQGQIQGYPRKTFYEGFLHGRRPGNLAGGLRATAR